MMTAVAVVFAAGMGFGQAPNTLWYEANPDGPSFTISTADELAALSHRNAAPAAAIENFSTISTRYGQTTTQTATATVLFCALTELI